MKREIPEKYDHRTMNIIRGRVARLDDHAIVVRECSRSLHRDRLLAEWVTTSGNERQALRSHLAECIKLADFELCMIHDVMKHRGISRWSDSLMLMKEADNKIEV